MTRARRAASWVVLAACAALVGSAVAQSATPARPARKAAGGDSVLVRIGGETITRGMVQRRIEELPEHLRPQFVTPEGRQRLLERMVEEQVWLLTARRAGVLARPEVQRQIEQQRRDLVIRTYVNELMAANPAPADSELIAYYEEHPSEFKTPASVTISHIQVKSEAEARRVRQAARTGDWTRLAARYSTDTLTNRRGGSLGPASRDGIFAGLGRQPALAESAFALKPGAIGGPIRTDRGWHVIRVEAQTLEGSRPFEQVRALISRQLGAKRSQDYYQAQLTQAKEALNLRADSSAIKKFVATKRTPRELFTDAQSAGSATARIEAYRKLLQEHPESDVSPQAAFMIGFIQSEELKDYESAEKSFQDLLARYPKSELTASARWMLTHMRNQDAPEFMNLESDSSQVDSLGARSRNEEAKTKAGRGGTTKP